LLYLLKVNNMKNLEQIYLATYFLIESKQIKQDSVIQKFLDFLKVLNSEKSLEEHLEKYSDFLCALFNKGEKNFSKYVEKIYRKNCKPIPENEIEIIKNLSSITFSDIKQKLLKKFPAQGDFLLNMPEYLSSDIDFKNPKDILQNKNDKFKIFKENRAFVFDNDFEIKPLDFNDSTKFYDLKGYKEQKRILFENTKALLENKNVNNILLYGESGCGKSSSVRALLNEFEELKMIQIFKNNLVNLDKLFAKLTDVPYKFVIFADDISFDDTDSSFSTMKAILEGSLIQCPKNAVIYATSNRRHLVKESFQSRKGDEIHLTDTINEIASLSERFGINLFFSRPTNEEFIEIVLELAQDNKIEIEEKHLIEKAQRMALIKGSRSPRIAKQLIDNLLAHVNI